MGNLSLEYNNREWGFSGLITYHYVGSRYRINDPYNIAEPLEPAKWGDLAFSQSFFDNAATLYFGIKNFSDRAVCHYRHQICPEHLQIRWEPVFLPPGTRMKGARIMPG